MDTCKLGTLTEQQWTFLFGLIPKTGSTHNPSIINTVLAFARKALWIVRNYSVYEGKTLCVKTLWTNMLKAHLKCLFKYKKSLFCKVFISNNSFINLDGNENLVLRF